MSTIGNNDNQSYWEPKINVQLGSLTRLAIPGPRCEGHPSGGMGDATTDDPSLQWSTCIPFLNLGIFMFPILTICALKAALCSFLTNIVLTSSPCCLKSGGKGNLEDILGSVSIIVASRQTNLVAVLMR